MDPSTAQAVWDALLPLVTAVCSLVAIEIRLKIKRLQAQSPKVEPKRLADRIAPPEDLP